MNVTRSFFVIVIAGMISAVGLIPTGSVFLPTQTAFAQTDPNAAVAATVASYFSDIPVMIAIAGCESGPRQFATNGAPLYAGTNDEMVGVFQIDSSIHTAPARALGFDITTLAGNMGYARYLYGAEGTDPWISSFSCWGGATSGANASATIATATPSSTGITVATSSNTTATTTATTIAATSSNDPAELASLQSRIAALVAIVQQLEAELAAKA